MAGLEKPLGEGKGYPLQYSGLENSMDCNPWVRKDLDTTERLLLTQLCLTLATPWTVAHQAPLFMGFSRQECWSLSPFPSPEIYEVLWLSW